MAHHDTLRAQNDKVVRTGMAMENLLKPIENGIRIEGERKAARDAAARTRLDGEAAEGEKEDEPVQTV